MEKRFLYVFLFAFTILDAFLRGSEEILTFFHKHAQNTKNSDSPQGIQHFQNLTLCTM